MAHSVEVREEAVRLRLEEQLGLAAIAARLSVSKGSVSLWLRPYPLSAVRKGGVEAKPLTFRGQRSTGNPALVQMAAEREYTTQQRGRISEAAVTLRLLLQGYWVLPAPEGLSYDLVAVVIGSHTMLKIQVKTIWLGISKGDRRVTLQRTRREGPRKLYAKGDFDFLVAYDATHDMCFVWSWDEVEGKASVNGLAAQEEAWNKLL